METNALLTGQYTPQNIRLLKRMDTDIRLRGLAENTRQSYLKSVRIFLDYCGDKAAENLNEQDARAFLTHLMRKGDVSNGTINSYNAGIRFFFATTLNRTMNYLQMPRFKYRKKLPVILSREEIAKLIGECTNLKHRAFFLIAYGGGLRISEIAALRTKDIDSKTMRIFVRDGKGGKDRFTLLSNECLCALREYWSVYRPKHPEGWLFLGVGNHTHISDAAIANAFDAWTKRVGITKDVSMHTLRHDFATHLLEDGATIFQIKELLGHASLSSTAVYLHLANINAGVTSPADVYVPYE
jgi:site-specific recombinase XerD